MTDTEFAATLYTILSDEVVDSMILMHTINSVSALTSGPFKCPVKYAVYFTNGTHLVMDSTSNHVQWAHTSITFPEREEVITNKEEFPRTLHDFARGCVRQSYFDYIKENLKLGVAIDAIRTEIMSHYIKKPH